MTNFFLYVYLNLRYYLMRYHQISSLHACIKTNNSNMIRVIRRSISRLIMHSDVYAGDFEQSLIIVVNHQTTEIA